MSEKEQKIGKSLKGIVLAGGAGKRLYPATAGLCKQLLPVYDKPMIYYPLSVLMLAGIQDILIVSAPQDQAIFQHMLGDGSQFGIRLSYAVQDEPRGVAHALLVAQSFIAQHPVCLVLGDNLFYGQGFSGMLHQAIQQVLHEQGATVFSYPVNDVRRFGAVTLNADGTVKSIEEKPELAEQAKAGLALTGLYFLDAKAGEFVTTIKPSARGELEIADVLQGYLQRQQLRVQPLGRGFAWLDMGTCDALLDAAHFVQTLEKRQGFKVACLEEVAWRQGWLSQNDLAKQVQCLANNGFKENAYCAYLSQLLLQADRDDAQLA